MHGEIYLILLSFERLRPISEQYKLIIFAWERKRRNNYITRTLAEI